VSDGARYDAIVIGAGVAGAATAILLAQAGWSVAVVEKREFPRRKVCGECVAAPNLELLDALGVGAEFTSAAGPALERAAVYAGDDSLIADLPTFGRAHAFGRALAREKLDALLLARARSLGAGVWQPWAAVDVRRRDGLHVCRLVSQSPGAREEAALHAAVLIDAHGSWERAPSAHARERRAPAASDLFAFKANYASARLPRGLLPVLAFDGGYGGMVVADDDQLTLACCVRRDRLRGWRSSVPGETAGEAVEALLLESCSGVRDALRGATRIEPWLSVGPIRPGFRPAWSESGGFAVGNAAGEAHPILGEGISMALQGAWLLCAHLERGRASLLAGGAQAGVARAYARDWRASFGRRIRWAAVCAHVAMRPSAVRALRPVLRRWPALLTAAAVIGGKVRSPLAVPTCTFLRADARGAHVKVERGGEV
jgi:flavin-dependent dehydrogenase